MTSFGDTSGKMFIAKPKLQNHHFCDFPCQEKALAPSFVITNDPTSREKPWE
jgi:hypothetical protein